ncbi:MAG: flagellar FleN [Zoogloeaceae bacterium]|nr:flagellar FleN [Zoogloeaceae bacterium]
MLDLADDQAAGLRRLFRRSPPAVVAVYSAGRYAEANLLRLVHRLASGGRPVTVLDECSGPLTGFTDARVDLENHDLLHALDGRVPLTLIRQRLPGDVVRIPVALAAPLFDYLDDQRRQRLIDLLSEVHRQACYVLVRAADAQLATALSWAAPRRVLVAEASGPGATGAFTVIKSLAAAGAATLHVTVARARNREDARAFFLQLQTLVRNHVGLPLAWMGEIERDDPGGELAQPATGASARDGEQAFLRRLQGWQGNSKWIGTSDR